MVRDLFNAMDTNKRKYENNNNDDCYIIQDLIQITKWQPQTQFLNLDQIIQKICLKDLIYSFLNFNSIIIQVFIRTEGNTVSFKNSLNLQPNNQLQIHQKIKLKIKMQLIFTNPPYQVPVIQNHPIMTKDILKAYEKVLSYSNLKLHRQISHRNVRIQENQYIHQIYTKNDSNLPHLVFLHGYGGTSMTALRMFQHIFNHFQVHALDTYGIGYSSRGNFKEDFDFEQTKQYYVEALQKWRKATNIQKFHLVGHSFGGYIASLYAMKYPQRIQHLYLVSPAGTNQRLQIGGGEKTFKTKLFLCIGQLVYNMNIRPSKAMTNFFIGEKIISSILTNRLKIPQQEQNDWKKYFAHVNSQDASSQIGFYKFFDWPLNPKVTIEDMIRKSNFPFMIDFYFGDSDWMPRDGAVRLVEQRFKGVRITTISDSGHQIVFDNSSQLCEWIISHSEQN